MQACAFAASNQGKYVAHVFLETISGREKDYDYHKFVLKRIKGSPLSKIISNLPLTQFQKDF